MRIGIVIVNYNRRDLLEKCLSSLEKIEYSDYRIVVVDNGSTDDSVEMTEKKFPEIKIIRLPDNRGFAEPNNKGIGWLLNCDCEAVLLLNNDTEVDQRFLKEMADCIDIKKRFAMVSAKVLFSQNREKIDAIGHVITPDGFAKHKGLLLNADSFKRSIEIFSPYGAAALYHKNLLEDIVQEGQYLDEDFKIYVEDLDLGWRARLRGWKCVFAPKAIVYHHKSATSGAYSEVVAFYTNRNILYNIIKNYPFYFAGKAVVLTLLRYPILFFGFIFNRGPASRIKSKIGYTKLLAIAVKSTISVICHLSGMIQKRKYIQRRILVEKKEIGRWFSDFGISFIDSVYK